MNAIKATVMQGRLELKVPLDWPDGTEVLIEPTMAPLEKIGIDESEGAMIRKALRTGKRGSRPSSHSS